MTRQQFNQAAVLLDKISNENAKIDDFEQLKERGIVKTRNYEITDGYGGKLLLTKQNAISAIDAEIVICHANKAAFEAEFSTL